MECCENFRIYICEFETRLHFSFDEITHPPHRYGLSGCWLDTTIIAQVSLATIKGHSKMCSFITQHNATDVLSFEGACNWHSDCRNVHQSCCPWTECSFSTISRLQRRFREFGSTSNRPHNGRPRVTTPAQDLHIQYLHLQDRMRPATRTAAATIGLHKQRISENIVRNPLREAHLHACLPHRGFDLTAVRRRNRLELANAHIRWRLALWRGDLFTDESRFSLYRADEWINEWMGIYIAIFFCVLLYTQRVGERFADFNVVDRVAHGGRRMLWTPNTGAFYWWHFECTEITWRDPEKSHCCAIHPRPSPHVVAW